MKPQPNMTDADLLLFAHKFRDGILAEAGVTSSETFCYAISLPMEAILVSHGFACALTEGAVAGGCHFFITLPDGRILDPTADQFRKPKGSEMPPVYLGERPSWYAIAKRNKAGDFVAKLPRPDAEHVELHSFFTALAERGIGGEKANAAKKLEHLCRYFDFTPPARADLKDIFAKVAGEMKFDHEARHVRTFSQQDGDLAQWVQWAVGNGLQCETTLRIGKDWTTSVHAHVGIGSLARVSTLADRIAVSFTEAWQRFKQVPGVRASDRSIFFRGLYDGMMDDPRKHGEPLPTVSFGARPKAKRGQQTIAIHPYTLAFELGRALRIDTSLDDILAIIDSRTGGELANKAA